MPSCRDQAIALVHRSDGSGTTFIFTNYLSKVSADWKSKVGSNTSVEWPAGIGAKGNEGVANNVGNTKGAIGYVETAYAKQNKLTTTKMVNKDGKTVAPTPEAIMAAAAGADWAHAPGFYMILTDSPGAKSWPIAGATFILVPKQPKDAAADQGSAQVLRLGLQERRRNGAEPRLRPDARQRRGADPGACGRARSRAPAASRSSELDEHWEKAPVPAPFPCPPPVTRRLVMRPPGRLSGAPGRAAAKGEPDATAGRQPVVDVALQGGASRSPTGSIGARCCSGCARAMRFSVSSPAPRARGPPHARRHYRLAGPRLAAGAARLRLRLPVHRELEPGDREVRRPRADLRHHRHLVHRHADRGAGRPVHRAVPHRTVPDVAAPPDRHRHRAARRHSQHHLRHLGSVRVRAVPAAVRAAVPDRPLRRRSRCCRQSVRRPALRHRHAHRRA